MEDLVSATLGMLPTFAGTEPWMDAYALPMRDHGRPAPGGSDGSIRGMTLRARARGGYGGRGAVRRGRAATRVALSVGVAIAAVGGLGFDEGPARAAGEPERPNILLVVTDDQREGKTMMPELRANLVRRGVAFRNAFVTTPSCCPSRASIYTGRYSHNTGVVDNSSASAIDENAMIQAYLKEGGYKTALVGKYLNKWTTLGNGNPSHFSKWAALRSDYKGYFYGGEWNINGRTKVVEDYSTTFVRQMSLRFLRQWDDRADRDPWYLAVTPTAPHKPSPTLPEYRDAPVPPFELTVEEDRSDKPPYVQATYNSPRVGLKERRKQFRSLLPVDDMIGKLVESLQEKGELDNTLIFFTSDNGYLWGEHGLTRKGVPYNESIRVPFFMRWDGIVEPRTRDDRLALNIDIAPTILDAADLAPEARAQMDGRSLLEPSTRKRVHTEFLSPEAPPGPWAATWTPAYHYIEYLNDDGTPHFKEYYDLTTDPNELVNLYQDGDESNDPSRADSILLSGQLHDDLDCEGPECP